MNLTIIKGRLKGAQTGHSLLKKKADALGKRFRTILMKIDEVGRNLLHLSIIVPKQGINQHLAVGRCVFVC